MHNVSESEKEHHIQLDVPNVVARHIRDMCREMGADANTIAQEGRYGGLANQIERQLNEDKNTDKKN